MRNVVIVGEDRFATQLFDFLVCSFTSQSRVQRIAPGDPNISRQLAGADWIIEMAGNDVGQKRSVLRHSSNVTTALVTSDSSVITRHELLDGLPTAFGGRYAVTHFFFPLSHCPLAELVATSKSDPPLDPALHDKLLDTLGRSLRRTTIQVPDSPGFIANRLGLFFIANGLAFAVHDDLDPIAVDLATAASLGSSTTIFRIADLIGHSTLKALLLELSARLPPTDPLRLIAPKAIARLETLQSEGRERFIDRAAPRGGQSSVQQNQAALPLIEKLRSERDSYMQHVCKETGVSPAEAADAMRKSYGWNVQW